MGVEPVANGGLEFVSSGYPIVKAETSQKRLWARSYGKWGCLGALVA